ncbi:alpha-L-arabinofuranosidase C-terminal domain-containing protein [Flavobacterium aquicola]|uniref:non-reducing end alpha-L-arabinofuranosidase n=1 Tax=Flavobacterium aquicola TaxID=1682742 RepID=A0A3E0E2S1_9FLAO|nr:alpha-L-arabinofuranosidase C-terminal domain-containing protein [Flavobacterium aquicola]REG91629.1 alpha-L-arabinofuranosidase [Flavobacterium aquicola]
MKYYLLLFCFQLSVLNITSQNKKDAEIFVDLKQKPNEISPLLYGQFIEFLGRSIDGGIYDEKSVLSNEEGFRKDVLKSVQDLKTPLLRYPGGTVVKIYHWKDGIGAKESRPKRKNLIWGGIMDNHFGTAEFVKYCREIGAEPFLVVNMSTDSPNDASDWVEYCNGTGDTYWANLRRLHGYQEPFNVKYWGIGNEEYAEPDAGKHQNVNKYIEDSWHIIKLMKLQDPSIKITLVGNADDLEWSKKVVSEMHPVCDFLAVHFYSMPSDSKYSTLFQSVDSFNEKFDSIRTLLNTVPAKVQDFPVWYRFPPRSEPLKLAIDEWGIWDMQSNKGTGVYNLEYPYNWAQALAVGKFLNMFQRNADIIGLATWAQTVNVLAAIMTTEKGSYHQTVYTPLKAYRQYSQQNNLNIVVNTPASKDKMNLIDAAASISNDRKEVTLAVINLSENESVKTKISFGNLEKMELKNQIIYTAPSLDAINTLEKNIVTETKIKKNIPSKNGFEITLQSGSINFLTFEKIDKK